MTARASRFISLVFACAAYACAPSEPEGAQSGGAASAMGGFALATGGANNFAGGMNTSSSAGGVAAGGRENLGGSGFGGANSTRGGSANAGSPNAFGGASIGGTSSAGSGSGASNSGGMSGGQHTSGGETGLGGASNGGNSGAGASSFGGRSSSGGAVGTCVGPFDGFGALPPQSAILSLAHATNDYFMRKVSDPTRDIVTDRARPSNLWTRAVYYEGLMGLHSIEPDAARKASYYDYAARWGASPNHPWQLVYGGITTRNADNQCCGQTYIDLYRLEAQAERIRDVKADIDAMVASSASADWTWIDAIQMAMPVFAKLGALYSASSYFSKMHALYENTKTTQGLYNTVDHLWWRDATFKPPFATPSGKSCYWSRGNGWVFAALVRVLDAIPSNAVNRAEYVTDFQAMAEALRMRQRADGFWNVSLDDPADHGGPESTGTALFTYGFAWGIRNQLLDPKVYSPAIVKAWCALASAVHSNGAIGYAQGTGSKPADGQPVTFDSAPDFEDFPVGCFLLAASETYRLASP